MKYNVSQSAQNQYGPSTATGILGLNQVSNRRHIQDNIFKYKMNSAELHWIMPMLKGTLHLGWRACSFEVSDVGKGMFKISIMMWMNILLFLATFVSRKMSLYGDKMGQRKGHSLWFTCALEVSNIDAVWNTEQISKSQHLIMSLFNYKFIEKHISNTYCVGIFYVCLCKRWIR